MSEAAAETASPSPQEVRKSIPVTEEDRLKEAKRLAAKHRQEQIVLQQKAEARRTRQQQQLQAEIEAEKDRREKERQQSLEEKSRKLEELQERSKQRKDLLALKAQRDQESTKNIGNFRYARETLEEDFIRRVIQPEGEMKEKIRVQKKLTQKCPTLSDLRSHAARHDEVMAQANERTQEKVKQRRIDFRLQEVSLFPQSHFSRSLLEQDRETKLLQDKAEEQRKLMKLRQDRYALLVKEMFAPRVALRPERVSESPKQPQRVRYTPPEYAKPKVKPMVRSPRKQTVARSEPSLKPHEDYLTKFREDRESIQAIPQHIEVDWTAELSDDLSPTEKLKRVREKADKVEKRLKRAEVMLSTLSPTSPGVLEATQQMSDSLVSSIQAKLRLIKS